MKRFAFAPMLALAACTTTTDPVVVEQAPPRSTEVQLLAINDFHGRLEAPSRSMTATLEDGSVIEVPVGGAAYLAGAMDALDTGTSIRVAAGDLIGATPLPSALFLDEPSIEAMNILGLQYSALGNHEFDEGVEELLRIAEGGCETYTEQVPCALDGSYEGADFLYMAANVFTEEDETLMPATAVHDVGGRRIGFIGMPLAGTPRLVAPNRVDGLRFANEVETANALVASLNSQGAETIVLLLHEGGYIEDGGFDDCVGLSGPVADMLPVLDEAISVIVSGHSRGPYNCRVAMPSGIGERVLTHGGAYGVIVSDIRLEFGEAGFIGARAENILVQGDAFVDADGRRIAPSDLLPRFAPDAEMEALVDRVVEAAAPQSRRIVGTLGGAVAGEQAGYLIADSQFAATAAQKNGAADFAVMNPGGVRSGFVPGQDGTITFGQAFEVQPFGNSLMTVTLTGAEIKNVFEQGIRHTEDGSFATLLRPSWQLSYAYDMSRPDGENIVWIKLNGETISPEKEYRVTTNNFIANGGDGFTLFLEGRDRTGAGSDIDAITAWLADGRDVPELGRIINLTPTP